MLSVDTGERCSPGLCRLCEIRSMGLDTKWKLTALNSMNLIGRRERKRERERKAKERERERERERDIERETANMILVNTT